MTEPDLFIFAGEPSGDLHGEKLLKTLLDQNPNLSVMGVGGPRMRRHNMDLVLPMEAFQVMGFVDVFLALPKLLRQFRLVKRAILESNPKKVLFIDYPGFNLRMARALRKAGYKGIICHYICPSVWAWGKKRIGLMAENLNLLLSILPFETACFTNTSLPVLYVGHPLIHTISSYHYTPIAELENKKVLGLFPGSRHKELLRNLSVQLDVAHSLKQQDPTLTIAISVAQERYRPMIEALCKEKQISAYLIPHEHTYDLMKQCHTAFATSGTVTLELALHKVPTVVTYGISKLDVFIAKNILRILLPFYCIVNIIVEEEVFPELIGPNLTKEALLKHAISLLQNQSAREACLQKCRHVRALLTEKNAHLEAAKELSALSSSTM